MNINSNDSEQEATNAMFRRLRAFKAATQRATRNKDKLAIAMIGACIVEGMTTRKRIVAALRSIGLNKSRVVALLHEFAGPDPERHRWATQDDETYRLHGTCLAEDAAAPHP